MLLDTGPRAVWILWYDRVAAWDRLRCNAVNARCFTAGRPGRGGYLSRMGSSSRPHERSKSTGGRKSDGAASRMFCSKLLRFDPTTMCTTWSNASSERTGHSHTSCTIENTALQFTAMLSEVCQNIVDHAEGVGWVARSRTPGRNGWADGASW